MSSAVVAVTGGSGGIGASTFAAMLAAAAGAGVLVDLDPVGGGIDVLLGVESQPGARWSGLRLRGGRLDPVLLRDGLPQWRGLGVLAADGVEPTPAAVLEVIEAAGRLGPVVLDVPRWGSQTRAAALSTARLAVVVTGAQVRDVAAARAVLAGLGDRPVGVVVRGGGVPAVEAARLVGAPLLGELPARTRAPAEGAARVARAVDRVARGILDGVAVYPIGRAGRARLAPVARDAAA